MMEKMGIGCLLVSTLLVSTNIPRNAREGSAIVPVPVRTGTAEGFSRHSSTALTDRIILCRSTGTTVLDELTASLAHNSREASRTTSMSVRRPVRLIHVGTSISFERWFFFTHQHQAIG